jgi:hypothetical protein
MIEGRRATIEGKKLLVEKPVAKTFDARPICNLDCG